jgi:hypothetical protein
MTAIEIALTPVSVQALSKYPPKNGVSPCSAATQSGAPIIEQAAEIVRSYNTGVTLRQLFYRLVSEGLTSEWAEARLRTKN